MNADPLLRMVAVTPWFDGDENVPARPGVYRTRIRRVYGRQTVGWSYWDMRKWGEQCGSPDDARRMANFPGYSCKDWRGLMLLR